MKRLVLNPRAYIELLFDCVGREPRTWAQAQYPPACDPACGSVELRAAPDGSVVLHVERRELPCEDSRLRMLFATGVGVFATPRDLDRFAKGPLAQAFGIRVESDVPDASPDDAQLSLPLERSAEGGSGGAASEPAASAPRQAEPPKRPALEPPRLAEKLGRVIKGQDAALERVARLVCAQLAKEAPVRPATILLLGPTGTGKTSTVEALPRTLARLGYRTRLFRVDCNELTHSFQVSRLIGAPPGYVGYGDTPALVRALEQPGSILLLDEIDKAHRSVIGEVLLNLLDTGRLTASDGTVVSAAHAIIAMTSNVAAAELIEQLEHVPLENRWAVQRICRRALADDGFPPELLGRIGAFAPYAPLDDDGYRQAARVAVSSVAGEYGFRVARIEPVVVEVVLDVAGDNDLGARALHYAATELLSDAFVAARARGLSGPVAIEAGPPVGVVPYRRTPRSRRKGARRDEGRTARGDPDP